MSQQPAEIAPPSLAPTQSDEQKTRPPQTPTRTASAPTAALNPRPQSARILAKTAAKTATAAAQPVDVTSPARPPHAPASAARSAKRSLANAFADSAAVPAAASALAPKPAAAAGLAGPASADSAPPAKSARTAKAASARGNPNPPPPALFQDAQQLRRMQIQSNRSDVVVLRCARPAQEILGPAHVHKSAAGQVTSISLPPKRLHIARARTWLRRELQLGKKPLQQPAPVPSPADGQPVTTAAVQQHVAQLRLDALMFAVYATVSITILPPPPNGESFTLRLEYPSAAVGEFCKGAFEQRMEPQQQPHRAEEEHKSAVRAGAPAAPHPFASVSSGTERFVCGLLRGGPWRVLTPTPKDISRMLTPLGATDIHLRPLEVEFAFTGEMEFAVPVRCLQQLETLKAKFPSMRFLKKVRPLKQVCSKCWQTGHGRRHCAVPAPLCKHCRQQHDGVCPLLSKPKNQWPECVLCSHGGHCVTSCPSFRPSLVPMELSPRQPKFQPAADAFPALSAAPAPAASLSVAAQPSQSRLSAPPQDSPPSEWQQVRSKSKSPAVHPAPASAAAAQPASRSFAAAASSAAHAAPSFAPAVAAPVAAVADLASIVRLLQSLQAQVLHLSTQYAQLHSRLDELTKSPDEEEDFDEEDEPMDDSEQRGGAVHSVAAAAARPANAQ